MPEEKESIFYCGVDVGSCTTKAAVLNARKEVVSYSVLKSGVDFAGASRRSFEQALASAGLPAERILRVVATGLGRDNVEFADLRRTEITCHGEACFHYFPGPVTIVDVGGQDNKVIQLNGRGERIHFKMNRKCAAGTGAFLEEIANRIDVPLEKLNEMAGRSRNEAVLGSFCTVFTQTEILAKIRQGALVEDIVKGAFRSVIKRILEMDPLLGEVVATGGVVAHNPVIVSMLQEQIGRAVRVPPLPQVTGAIGAALIAMQV
jgi:predicted CoA-substrate-specific enzyme activase